MNTYLKKYFTYIRFAVGAVLAGWLIYRIIKTSNADIPAIISRSNYPLLISALVIHGIIACIACYRWGLLLRVQRVYLPFYEIIRLTLIGIFFNIALPGAVSGDFIKMYLLTKYADGKEDEAILTVLLDRFIGLFGLFLVASFVILFCLSFFHEVYSTDQLLKNTALISIIVCLICFLSYIAFAFRENFLLVSVLRFPVKICQIILPKKILFHLNRIVMASDMYRKHRFVIIAAICLSLIIHTGLGFNLYLIGISLGGNEIKLHQCLVAAPIANAVAAIPLTPGGIGTRDTTISYVLQSMSISQKIAGIIPIILTMIIIFWALVGGILFCLIGNPSKIIEKQNINKQSFGTIDKSTTATKLL